MKIRFSCGIFKGADAAQADYLHAQLVSFMAGTRFDTDGNMTAAAQALTPADIETLAGWLSTLR